VLTEALTAYRAAFGPRLVAGYALGSLAHGGFSPLVSDVDLGLVLADPVDPCDGDEVHRIAAEVKAGGSPLHERLSVFWGTPATLGGRAVGGRFPPLDRLDLLEYGRLLAGADARAGLPRPGRAELLVAGAEFALDFLAGIRPTADPTVRTVGSMRPAARDAVDELRRPAALLARGVRHVTKLVLFPVRFLYTAETGRVGTNEHAAAHYLRAGRPPAARLVAEALVWRTNSPDPAAAEALLGRELVPLYLHYIDDHAVRLAALDRADLVEAFGQWRDLIVPA
jgi:hypothetical protein